MWLFPGYALHVNVLDGTCISGNDLGGSALRRAPGSDTPLTRQAGAVGRGRSAVPMLRAGHVTCPWPGHGIFGEPAARRRREVDHRQQDAGRGTCWESWPARGICEPRGRGMTNPTEAFFDELGRRGYDPLVGRVSGAMRFEVTQRGKTDVRQLRIDRGHLSLSHDKGEPDCVIRAERSVFDSIIGGKANAMAALLRGALSAKGDAQMMVVFRRLLPPLPTSDQHHGVTNVAGW